MSLVNVLTPGWRRAAYIFTALGTPLVAYLNAKGILDASAVTLWSAEVAVVGVTAAANASETVAAEADPPPGEGGA